MRHNSEHRASRAPSTASLPAALVHLWVDGSYMPATGRMGAGGVVLTPQAQWDISEPLTGRPADSGRAEILAAAIGLESLMPGSPVVIHADHCSLLSVLEEISPSFRPGICLIPGEKKLKRIKRLMRGAKCEDWQRLLAAASRVHLLGCEHVSEKTDENMKLAHDLARLAASSNTAEPLSACPALFALGSCSLTGEEPARPTC